MIPTNSEELLNFTQHHKENLGISQVPTSTLPTPVQNPMSCDSPSIHSHLDYYSFCCVLDTCLVVCPMYLALRKRIHALLSFFFLLEKKKLKNQSSDDDESRKIS